jgi:hypothetical protein
MALPNLIVSAVAEWNGKALTKGSTQINKFEKTVRGLGRTLGITFSAAALLGYSKKAVSAYGEQIAEVKRLDTALRNLGFNFATDEAEGYIDSVEKVTGVNRDQLQPSFIQLAQTTRSTTMAQSMLNTALDISAGTGMDLAGATKILSQAYVGNYKGLKQLNLGLTNAELATKSYLEVEKLIAAQYAGQSKNAADSYEGSLNRLKIAAEQASEQIGQALVSSLATSSGGMDKLIDKVDGAADSISGLITNVSVLSKDLKDLFSSIPGAGVLENVFRRAKNQLGKLSIGNLRNQVDILKGRQGGFPQGAPQDLKTLQANAEKAKMDKAAIKLQKERIALEKKAALAKKNELSLSKAAAEFDTNRISIAAALRATYDQETRLRLEALMAIENDNGALALEKINQLSALQAASDAQKLAGVMTISETTLSALNAQLLKELEIINTSKIAEGDKELAREEAFKKYNAAITAAGTLAAEESYSEKTRIELNKIAKLAALSDTANAAKTLILITESEELNAINRIKAAQKAADDQRMASLQAYIAALKSLGGTGSGANLGGGPKVIDPALAAALAAAEAAKKAAEAAKKAADEAAAKNAADAKALQDAAAKAAAEAAEVKEAVNELKDATEALADATSTGALSETAAALAELADAQAAELDATGTIGPMGDLATLSPEALMPGYTRIPATGAFDRDYTININAGVIATQDELAVLIQDTLQRLNRNGDPITTAGIA